MQIQLNQIYTTRDGRRVYITSRSSDMLCMYGFLTDQPFSGEHRWNSEGGCYYGGYPNDALDLVSGPTAPEEGSPRTSHNPSEPVPGLDTGKGHVVNMFVWVSRQLVDTVDRTPVDPVELIRSYHKHVAPTRTRQSKNSQQPRNGKPKQRKQSREEILAMVRNTGRY